MKVFLITFYCPGGQSATVPQRGTTREMAIQTVQSTGAKVISAQEVDSTAFNELWPFIGGRLNIHDDDAQSMALRLMAKGITTWEQWVNAGEVIA
jgi:hypothetical protein